MGSTRLQLPLAPVLQPDVYYILLCQYKRYPGLQALETVHKVRVQLTQHLSTVCILKLCLHGDPTYPTYFVCTSSTRTAQPSLCVLEDLAGGTCSFFGCWDLVQSGTTFKFQIEVPGGCSATTAGQPPQTKLRATGKNSSPTQRLPSEATSNT